MCRCIMGQQQADARLCTPLCLHCVCNKSVILIDQSKPFDGEAGGKEVGLRELNSMSLYQLLLFFHGTRVSQSDKFIQQEIHSWTADKSRNCGSLCVCMCISVHAFNPSVICFLLPSHECRDFSIRPWSPWRDTSMSWVAQRICCLHCCWGRKEEMG